MMGNPIMIKHLTLLLSISQVPNGVCIAALDRKFLPLKREDADTILDQVKASHASSYA